MKQITLALVTVAMAGGSFARAQDDAADSARRIRDRIASMRISIDFNNARIGEVVAYFQEFTGFNFHLDPAVAANDEAGITIRLKDVSVKTALKLILRPRDLACVYRQGVLVVASKKSLGSQTVTRVYDVRDLMLRIADFPGPKMDFDTQNPGVKFEPLGDEPATTFTEESLIDLIKANTGDRSWEDAESTIQQVNGLLIISQSRGIHDEVRKLLDLLSQYK